MKTLPLPDGGRLAFRDEGRGPVVLLLHGWGVCSGFFENQIKALAQSHRVVTPDFRGHGRSTPLPADAGFGLLADDVHQLMNALDLHATVLVGWSMGAMVAWDLLVRHGTDRVAGLVTIDMVPRILNDGGWGFGLREGRDARVFDRSVRSMREDWPGFTRVFIPRIFARDGAALDPGAMEGLFRMAADNDPDSMARLWASMAEQDFRPQLHRIDVPVLVVHGERSQLYETEASAWLSEALPQARRVGFRDSGHAPHLEEPGEFMQLVDQFVRELSSDLAADARNPDSSGKQSTDGGTSS